MRKLLFICLVGLLSCVKEEHKIPNNIDGIYKGTFQRELTWAESNKANITLTFSSNAWTGTSDKVKYPALCEGTWSINGDTIIFINECAWTAEFDWSLILSGKYMLKTVGGEIEFYRDYRSASSDAFIDRYKIQRQN